MHLTLLAHDLIAPMRRIVNGRGARALLAAGLAAATVGVAWTQGAGWYALAFAVMPDIALAAGIGSGLEKGQLHPRAVRLYNTLHTYVGPVVLLAAALALGLGNGWVTGALAWATHIAVDRAVGYGFRTREGFIRG